MLGHLLLSLLVELFQLLQELRLGLHDGRLVAPALWAVPLSLRFRSELDTVEVEPLDRAEVVVATDHVSVGHLKRDSNTEFEQEQN